MKGRIIFKSIALHFGRFPFVITDRPDRSRQISQTANRSQISQILNGMQEGDGF